MRCFRLKRDAELTAAKRPKSILATPSIGLSNDFTKMVKSRTCLNLCDFGIVFTTVKDNTQSTPDETALAVFDQSFRKEGSDLTLIQELWWLHQGQC